jgi:trk system potassium uptake protein TrkH
MSKQKKTGYLGFPIKPWHLFLTEPLEHKSGDLSPIVLVFGFVGLIIIGALLLLLPVSSNTGEITSPADTFFTATSAVCVTGLVVLDTATHWSLFGQIVILGMIQMGGLGFMTSATLLILSLGRRVGLRGKLLIGETLGIPRLGGLVNLVKKIALFTLVSESIGTVIFYLHFSAQGSHDMLFWEALFQSISAFNNAGFDLFGHFHSFTNHPSDALLLLTTAALTILGGISYVVVADMFTKHRFSNFTLDTKIVLIASVTLLLFGTAVIFVAEFANPSTLAPLSVADKLLVAFFQSAVARTSGFTAITMAQITSYALFFILVLMFIGGAAGSTAGGIKVNTFGILIATFVSSLKGKEYAGIYEKEFVTQQIYRALAVVILSLTVITVVVFILTVTETFDFLSIFFETVSAFSNTGLSTGITPSLSLAGKLTIILTMFVGRLGPLTLTLSLLEHQKLSTYRYPQEAVRIV